MNARLKRIAARLEAVEQKLNLGATNIELSPEDRARAACIIIKYENELKFDDPKDKQRLEGIKQLIRDLGFSKEDVQSQPSVVEKALTDYYREKEELKDKKGD